jgi:hypothetical protein
MTRYMILPPPGLRHRARREAFKLIRQGLRRWGQPNTFRSAASAEAFVKFLGLRVGEAAEAVEIIRFY